MFLGAKWVIEALDRYHHRPPRATIMGKRIIFPNYHYLAALLHIYTGTFNLGQIAHLSGLNIEELKFQRAQLDFLTLVDYLKTKFSEWFRESLLLKDFSFHEYTEIAWEYTRLDEMVQSQIRIPLLERLKHLTLAGKDCLEVGKELDSYDRNIFRRLMLFFTLAEELRPTLCSRLVKDKALPVAERSFPEALAPLKSWSSETLDSQEMVEHLVQIIQQGTREFL